ncbi:hypothetical protein PENTCL1PPCAC_1457, partial [Pristionchus entomophagus]
QHRRHYHPLEQQPRPSPVQSEIVALLRRFFRRLLQTEREGEALRQLQQLTTKELAQLLMPNSLEAVVDMKESVMMPVTLAALQLIAAAAEIDSAKVENMAEIVNANRAYSKREVIVDINEASGDWISLSAASIRQQGLERIRLALPPHPAPPVQQ